MDRYSSPSFIEQQKQDKEKEKEKEEQEQQRIYLATDGCKSIHTRRAYEHAFNYFLEITVKNKDRPYLILNQM